MNISIYSRYYGLKTVEQAGRISLQSQPAASVKAYTDSLLHIMVRAETLDLLAARYYGRPDLWWRIADANPKKFPLNWKPGDTLLIPPIRIATQTPRV